MAMRRWQRRAVLIGAALAAVLLVAAAGGWQWLETRAGREFLAQRASAALSDESTTVRIDRLNGSPFASFAIGRLTIADRTGVFAEAEDIGLSWHPLALLRGALDVESLTVQRLALARVPEAPAGGAGPPGPPDIGLAVRIGTAAVRELALAPPVLGTAQRLSATATARFDPRAMQGALRLELKRLDGGPDRASVTIDYAAHPARFSASARIEEPSGGLLGRLAGLPRGAPLSVDLSGAGPPDAWQGRLKIAAGPGGRMDAALTVALDEAGAAVKAEGEATPGGLLPKPWQALAAPALRFTAEGGFAPRTGVTLKRLSLESAALSVTGSGGVGPDGSALSAKLSVATRDTGALAGLLPGLSVAKGTAEVSLAGTIAAPRADVSWRAERIGWQTARLASLAGTLALRPRAGAGFDASATAQGEGFAPGDEAPPGLLGESLSLTASARLAQDGTPGPLRVSVASGPTGLELTGTIDGTGAAEGSYALRLERIDALAPFNGRLDANGTFRAEPGPGVTHLTYDGALAHLTGAPAGLAALLGTRVPFAGRAELDAGGRLGVAGFRATAAAGRVELDGTVELSTGKLAAKARLAIDDLARLSKPAGVALAGRATANATLGGSLTSPSASGQAALSGLALDGAPLGGIGIGYVAQLEKGEPSASLRLGGALYRKKLDGRLNAALRGGTVALSGIDIALGRNRLTGSASLDPAHGRLAVDAAARLEAIADLPGAEGLGLAGSAEARAVSVPGAPGAVDLTIEARDLRLGTDGIGAASARLRLGDPLGRLAVSGTAEARNIRLATVTDGRAKIELGGGPGKLDWSASAAAGGAHPVTLSATGAATFGDAATRLRIATLTGMFAGQPFGLRAPFALETRPAGWRVEPVDFSLAGGRLRFEGTLDANGITVAGRLDALPVRLAALIAPELRLGGTLSGTLRVNGRAARPDVALSLTGAGIAPPDTPPQDFAGFGLSVELHQRGGSAEASARLTGPDETRLSLAVRTRALVSLDPAQMALGSDLPLAGELEATGRLALLDELVGLGEDRLAGSVSAKAKLAGTLGAPLLNGEARVTGGSYEGAVTGTVLRNLQARLAFAGDTVRVVSLSADDGGDGRLTGSGSVKLAGAAGASDGLTVELKRFTALRHRLGEAVASGKVTLSGLLGAPRIAGRVRIDRADIRIPDRLPEDVVELNVVEINRPPGAKIQAPPEPSASRALAAALDIALEFPRRTFVHGRGLDSEWKGALKVTGTTRSPVITGKLELVRGTFDFAGRSFTVKSGSVAFPSGGEPEIAATAEAQLKTLLARVEISGSISKLSIKVSSDPQLPQEDVLSHILFGQTAGSLNPIQAAQLAQTAATLSGNSAGGGIVDKIRHALGIDVLKVGAGDESSGKGATLQAGKYITEDVYVSVTQGAQPGSQKVGVEVQVLPSITVESDVSGTADSNIGVNWKMDY